MISIAENVKTKPNMYDINWSSIRKVLMSNFDWFSLIKCSTSPIGFELPGGEKQTTDTKSASITIYECCKFGKKLYSSDEVTWSKFTNAAILLTNPSVGVLTPSSAIAIVKLRYSKQLAKGSD